MASERIASWMDSVASRSSTKIDFVRLQSLGSSHHFCAPAFFRILGASVQDLAIAPVGVILRLRKTAGECDDPLHLGQGLLIACRRKGTVP